jgi:hypothetical protein
MALAILEKKKATRRKKAILRKLNKPVSLSGVFSNLRSSKADGYLKKHNF